MSKLSYCLAFFLLFSIIGTTTAIAQHRDQYKVVINHEEQYSIWQYSVETQDGWENTEIRGNLAKCKNYIDEVWTDMRPLSIQKMNLSEETEYAVVINHEEQYSIWPKEIELPENWRKTEFQGLLSPCVRYIKKVWTDMRPISQRKKMK
ncbi:MAG: MbtH family NRPS accessory protein [Flavobacteriaceae bacterium]|nr:MbtH family NRPS accessory protein [Flavobacteriaceae bacterium]